MDPWERLRGGIQAGWGPCPSSTSEPGKDAASASTMGKLASGLRGWDARFMAAHKETTPLQPESGCHCHSCWPQNQVTSVTHTAQHTSLLSWLLLIHMAGKHP